mmetsp:Transcript_6826/g.15095  ORF Transcript_6826/g.15095 Transcript_6826/m.15095 type:complete len:87 (-) Transcript_6826:340-600(-)
MVRVSVLVCGLSTADCGRVNASAIDTIGEELCVEWKRTTRLMAAAVAMLDRRGRGLAVHDDEVGLLLILDAGIALMKEPCCGGCCG